MIGFYLFDTVCCRLVVDVAMVTHLVPVVSRVSRGKGVVVVVVVVVGAGGGGGGLLPFFFTWSIPAHEPSLAFSKSLKIASAWLLCSLL